MQIRGIFTPASTIVNPLKFALSLQLLLILAFLLSGCAAAQPIELRPAGAIIASGAASPPVAGGNGIVLLNADFTSGGNARAVWDIPMRHDLSQSAGIRLRFRCINADLASEMVLHLNTGSGWYSAPFSPQGMGKWEELVIPKGAFLPENSAPGGSWRRMSRLRVAIWRGAPGKFQLQLASVEVLRANCPLAILRPALANGTPAANRAFLRYCRIVSEALGNGGIYPAVIEEPDLTSATLSRYRAAILPVANQFNSNALALLGEYLRNGGKAIAFHALSPMLANALQMPAGKFTTTAKLGLAPFSGVRTAGGAFFRQHSSALIAVDTPLPAGLKCRGWWIDGTGKATRLPAIIQSPYGMWFTHVFLNHDGDRSLAALAAFLDEACPGVRQAGANAIRRSARFAVDNAGADSEEAASARQLLESLQRQCRPGDYAAVLEGARQLRNALAEAAMPIAAAAKRLDGPKSELRGAWTRAKTGLPGENWFKTLKRMHESGLNAVFPNFFSPYYALYETPKAMPDPALRRLRDPVAACLAAAANYGIAVHAWCYVLNVSEAPESFRRQMAAQGRLQCRLNGATVPWLCPSDPRNRQLLCELLAGLLEAYPRLAGVHFDMIRFESGNVCYCERCRQAFNQFLGHPAAGWPECTLDASRDRAAWRAFRCGQINRLLQELSATARKINPRIAVSTAVYPDFESARNGVGQDWPRWLERKTVDFAAPMNYRQSAYLFQGDLARQRAMLGDDAASRMLPGIGMTVCNLDRNETLRQVSAVRNQGLKGFIIFEYAARSAEQLRAR